MAIDDTSHEPQQRSNAGAVDRSANGGFPATFRLRRGTDFRAVFETRVRAGDAHLLVFAVSNDLQHCRIGLSVSKKHGNAVIRNRKKRLLREAFRTVHQQLPVGLDLVLVPRQRLDASVEDFRRSLLYLARKLHRRLQSKNSQLPDNGRDAR